MGPFHHIPTHVRPTAHRAAPIHIIVNQTKLYTERVELPCTTLVAPRWEAVHAHWLRPMGCGAAQRLLWGRSPSRGLLTGSQASPWVFGWGYMCYVSVLYTYLYSNDVNTQSHLHNPHPYHPTLLTLLTQLRCRSR